MPAYTEIDAYNLKLNILGDDFIQNRNELRKIVIQKLWKESPGTGRGPKTAYYKYYVEHLSDEKRIFLTRPAVFKFGFDFLIHVEGYHFMNKKDNPKHDDITNDLYNKNKSDLRKYELLKDLINKVFHCYDPDDLPYTSLQFSIGFPADLILKVCKWFFIEQDIRYWNYSGRFMLKEGIDSI